MSRLSAPAVQLFVAQFASMRQTSAVSTRTDLIPDDREMQYVPEQ
ncbi:hypothetical protein [Thermosporothrix hazakensis]|nr:hypothetical protein [Thermosporothrix hazakensis]